MKTLLAVAAAFVATATAAQQYPDQGYGAPPPPPGYGAPPPPLYGAPPGYGDRRGYGPPEATFFVDDDFRGSSVTLNHGVPRLGRIGMEDKISSIVIRSGIWLVCADDDFRGRCVALDHSVQRLSEIGMEDNISSIRPLRPGERPRY